MTQAKVGQNPGTVPDGKPKDRDFVQTKEGLLFCLTGYLHPPDRYTAYLKYSPDPTGKWQMGQIGYRRELAYYHVSTVAATIRSLETHYPHYVSDCPVRGIHFSMVPHQSVTRYYQPQARLKELLSHPQDSLEQETSDLVHHLTSLTGLPAHAFGLTGSLLTKSHSPAFSDVDLLVYGQQNACQLRACLQTETGTQGVPWFRRPAQDRIDGWCQRVAQHHGISTSDAAYLAQRRWNYGFFGERYVSLHAIRQDSEITERYGDRVYRGLGAVRLRARLTDTSASLFLPATYTVDSVQVLDGDPQAIQVCEIVSYEGLFSDIAEPGAVVEAYGKLESVNDLPSRLVIGTQSPPGGYLRVLNPGAAT